MPFSTVDHIPEKGLAVPRSINRRLISGGIAAIFAASLLTAADAAAGEMTTDSQTLVTIRNGNWTDFLLCANPDDPYVWMGRDLDDPYCQWEQIGDDSQFVFFNPARGMVLSASGAGQPLALIDPVFPTPAAQAFALGEPEVWGSRALKWAGVTSVDAGSGDLPTGDRVELNAWNGARSQTWNVTPVGTPAAREVARSVTAKHVTSNQWHDRVLCAAADATVRLSSNLRDRACEWLPFGPADGPFVLYNAQYGKVITYSGGSGPLRIDDLTYPNGPRELWSFGPDKQFGAPALQWSADTTLNVDAGTTAPTTGPVRLRDWNHGYQKSLTWTFNAIDRSDRPTATVTLGDSFISGEAGRWKGNSNYFLQDRNGTDRAYKGLEQYDASIVYGWSYSDGCNRSDSAETHSSNTNEVQVNLACSGAETKNIYREPYKGEAPQADQLFPVAQRYDVKLIAVSIGGNDLGFGDIIEACITAFRKNAKPCNEEQQKIVIGKLASTRHNVVTAVNAIKQVMTRAGYDTGDYKLVLQSAPSPLPMGDEIRYGENGERTLVGGCPFWNADADWARGKLVGEISTLLKSAADEAAVGFLDLQNAFNGKEVCSKSSRLVDSDNPPSEILSEWVRFAQTGKLQGQRQESLHPNYYGQNALGRCLFLYDELAYDRAACTNTRGAGPERMVLTPIK